MNPVAVTIDQARTADLDEVLEILQDSVLGQYFDTPTARSILTEAHEDHELWVANLQGKAVGFSVCQRRGSFQVFPYLHLLAVRSGHRGLGVGGQLLAHLEARELAAPGYPFRPKVFLLVADSNPGAVKFYERHGYRRAAQFDDMFTEGDTEHLMVKDLGLKK